eukprot:8251251-Pyramimonas_sp.AAC.1
MSISLSFDPHHCAARRERLIQRRKLTMRNPRTKLDLSTPNVLDRLRHRLLALRLPTSLGGRRAE